MPSDNTDERSRSGNRALNSRSMLLGGTTLAAATAIKPVQLAQAQQAASPPGGKPNILVIFGDDIGIANISAGRPLGVPYRPAHHSNRTQQGGLPGRAN